MSSRAHYFRLGIFIILGVVVAIGIAIGLGGGKLFKRTLTIETYFNGSVQGLDVGSKVKYRGVLIGEVTQLGFTSTRYELNLPPQQRKPYVYVQARLDLDKAGFNGQLTAGLLQKLVAKGLRVRMSAQGITGTYFLEFDYAEPARAVMLPINWRPAHAYIPSSASAVTQILERADAFLAHFEKMNLPKVAHDLDTLLVTLNDKIDRIDVEDIGKDAKEMVADLRETAARINAVIAGPQAEATVRDLAASSARLRKILENPALDNAPQDAAVAMASLRKILESEDLQRSLRHLDSALASLDRSVAGKEADVAEIIDNLRRTSENLRDLSESVKRYPAGALWGEPPADSPRRPAR